MFLRAVNTLLVTDLIMSRISSANNILVVSSGQPDFNDVSCSSVILSKKDLISGRPLWMNSIAPLPVQLISGVWWVISVFSQATLFTLCLRKRPLLLLTWTAAIAPLLLRGSAWTWVHFKSCDIKNFEIFDVKDQRHLSPWPRPLKRLQKICFFCNEIQGQLASKVAQHCPLLF